MVGLLNLQMAQTQAKAWEPRQVIAAIDHMTSGTSRRLFPLFSSVPLSFATFPVNVNESGLSDTQVSLGIRQIPRRKNHK